MKLFFFELKTNNIKKLNIINQFSTLYNSFRIMIKNTTDKLLKNTTEIYIKFPFLATNLKQLDKFFIETISFVESSLQNFYQKNITSHKLNIEQLF